MQYECLQKQDILDIVHHALFRDRIASRHCRMHLKNGAQVNRSTTYRREEDLLVLCRDNVCGPTCRMKRDRPFAILIMRLMTRTNLSYDGRMYMSTCGSSISSRERWRKRGRKRERKKRLRCTSTYFHCLTRSFPGRSYARLL